MDNKNTYTITTSSGFTYEVDKDAFDDMEIFDDLMLMEDPDVPQAKRLFATNRVFRRMLGEKQRKALDEFLRARDGKIRISAYQKEIQELFTGLDEAKKK